MHTLLFLDPGHFHAALTLRVPHPRVADEVFVYAREGAELRDFLALVERFNRRPAAPTRWRPVVTTCDDPLGRLVAERRGEVVVLAGKNGGKAHTMRRLHEAGFHVLADKPWLVQPDDLESVRASLAGWPLVMEIMTGRHDAAARLLARLAHAGDVLGDFRDDGPAIVLDSVHQLEKLVDGAPLRRPWWFFDVRVQGSGVVDIPTHLVDQTQWLAARTGTSGADAPQLLSARAWETRVPGAAFRRITGEREFPRELLPFVERDALGYLCNAELVYRIGRVTARISTRWELSSPAGGGDTSSAVVHGTRADLGLEQSALTGQRRRLFVTPRADGEKTVRAVMGVIGDEQADMPRIGVEPVGAGRYEITIPSALDTGHESHFARVLDEFLRSIDERSWPASLAERTLGKYTLLAEAARAGMSSPHAVGSREHAP
jgi:predicted dehydrogenase